MSTFSPSDINIASQPFRRERAQNALLAGIAGGLVLTLVLLVSLVLRERVQAKDLRQVINAERQELDGLQSSQRRFSSVLSKPANTDIFSRSVLLNELIARRAVSWTRVFEDLATVLPSNVRLLSVRLPQVASDDATGRNRVLLDMSVGSERPEAVFALMKHLQESKLFGSAAVLTQNPPSQNDPLYRYRLTVAYAQKL